MAGGVRKLFISNKGLDNYVDKIYENSSKALSKEEIKNNIMQELKLVVKKKHIKSISIRDNGEMRIRTNDLFISTTDTGILRKFIIGRWNIEIDWEKDIKFYADDYEKYGFISGCWGGDTVHPHISGRTHIGCLGNVEGELYKAYQLGNVRVLVILLIGYLTSVNIADSAGKYLSRCIECELDEEGNPKLIAVNPGEFVYKYKDNEFSINREYPNTYRNNREAITLNVKPAVDKEHHEYLIANHHYKCNVCGKVRNEWHLEKVKIPSKGTTYYACSECKDKIKTCDVCGDVAMANKFQRNAEGTIFCENCIKDYCSTCNLCDEVILPHGKPEEILYKILELGKCEKDLNHSTIYKSSSGKYVKKPVCDSCCNAVAQNDKLKVVFKKYNVNPLIYKVTEIDINSKVAMLTTSYEKQYKIIDIKSNFILPNCSPGSFNIYQYYNLYDCYRQVHMQKVEYNFSYELFMQKYLIALAKITRGSEDRYIDKGMQSTFTRSSLYNDWCIIPKVLLTKPWEDIGMVDNKYIMSSSNTDIMLKVTFCIPTEARQREIITNGILEEKIFV